MNLLKLVTITTCLLLAAGNVFADDYADTIAMFKSTEQVKPFFSHSYGFAVFPSIGKGGLIVGAASGRGRVYVGGKVTGTVKMSQVSIGAQLGGQTYSQIIFFEDERVYRDFTSAEFEFGANANAIAITSSAQAQAGSMGSTASANESFSKNGFYKGMAVFTKGNAGFMFEASISGQKYKFKPLAKHE